MDTKKLIEEARKIAEEQKEQELIKEALEVLAADPAPSTNVTPQQFLDRLVAVVKKVDERSTTKDTALHTTITTEQSSKIKYYAGQTIIFNHTQVTPSKFADATLFDKVALPALTIPFVTTTRTKTFLQFGYGNVDVSIADWTPKRLVWAQFYAPNTNNNHSIWRVDSETQLRLRFEDSDSANGNGVNVSLSGHTVSVQQNGSNYGKLTAFVVEYEQIIPSQVVRATAEYHYIAKKDITFAEMGE